MTQAEIEMELKNPITTRKLKRKPYKKNESNKR